jgi:protein phosphatase
MLQPGVNLREITIKLNQLLLGSSGELPLFITVAGYTDKGPVLKQNEDTCYPNNLDDLDTALKLPLSVVCDGIGGHEGGEVASQLAIQSLKLQVRALLTEITQQSELIPPDLLQKQLQASLRVVNNVVWSRNDEQNRQGKERMATTLVMALQIPQKVTTTSGWKSDNAHELYLASIGDSRAYWITSNYCQRLTIDDDIAQREVRLAQSFYRQAMQKPHANALTQALGTKEADSLHFAMQRFIIEEEGILLLCSDGLSDNGWLEQSWRDYAIPVLTGELSIDDAARSWIEFAYKQESQDNIALVLNLCRVSQAPLVTTDPLSSAITTSRTGGLTLASSESAQLDTVTEESLTESSLALLDLDLSADKPIAPPPANRRKMVIGGLFLMLVGASSLGLFAWWQLYPQSFQQTCRQLPQQVRKFCPQARKSSTFIVK